MSAMGPSPWRRPANRKTGDDTGPMAKPSVLAHGAVTHRSPSGDDAEMPCCGRTLAQVPAKDRVTTDPALVTCRG
jgi:hypothetical protein